ncbi:MAG TPA: hypothetical protein VF463_18840 [Sphingobium sp.]
MEVKSHKLVDPDPFTIAGTFMTLAALVLQFVQVRQGASSGKTTPHAVRDQNLGNLDDQCSTCEDAAKKLLRSIERGSRDVDAELYNRPHRVGYKLELDQASHSMFRHNFAQFMTTVGGVSMWINHIIAEDTHLAGRLGDHLHGSLGDLAASLNQVLEQGRANREAIHAGKQALIALHDAIEAELGKGN